MQASPLSAPSIVSRSMVTSLTPSTRMTTASGFPVVRLVVLATMGDGFTTANVTYVDGPVAHLCQLGAGSCAVGVSVAACPVGKVAIGGGWMGDSPDPPVAATVAANAAANDKTGWGVVMVNDTDAVTASYHAFAACAG